MKFYTWLTNSKKCWVLILKTLHTKHRVKLNKYKHPVQCNYADAFLREGGIFLTHLVEKKKVIHTSLNNKTFKISHRRLKICEKINIGLKPIFNKYCKKHSYVT